MLAGRTPKSLLDATRLGEFSRERDNSHGARSAHLIPRRSWRYV
jgi:hypothetical protein